MKAEKIYKTCISIYNKAKKKRPNKLERDYLKLVLLTKPPYDYQLDNIIDLILDEHAHNINELAEFISEIQSMWTEGEPLPGWEERQRNLKLYKQQFKERNKKFFKEFWGD